MRKKRSAKPHAKPHWEMNGRQLAAATAEFDREMVVDEFRPPTRQSRARFERARRKRGRPRRGEGAQAISVTVERRLLAETDTLAKDLGLTRAGVIARGLRAVLAAEGRL
jgi:hypothetical protein